MAIKKSQEDIRKQENVFFTATEKEKILAVAQVYGMSFSQFLRFVAMRTVEENREVVAN